MEPVDIELFEKQLEECKGFKNYVDVVANWVMFAHKEGLTIDQFEGIYTKVYKGRVNSTDANLLLFGILMSYSVLDKIEEN